MNMFKSTMMKYLDADTPIEQASPSKWSHSQDEESKKEEAEFEAPLVPKEFFFKKFIKAEWLRLRFLHSKEASTAFEYLKKFN